MNNKQSSKGSGTVTLVIIAVTVLLYLFSSDLNPENLPVVIASVLIVAFTTVIVTFISRIKGNKGGDKKQTAVPLNRPFPQRSMGKTQHASVLKHRDEAEEVISCGHKSGKEKYLEQVEGFYKNGLIDRDEYKILRAKYEKLEIPEDYH